MNYKDLRETTTPIWVRLQASGGRTWARRVTPTALALSLLAPWIMALALQPGASAAQEDGALESEPPAGQAPAAEPGRTAYKAPEEQTAGTASHDAAVVALTNDEAEALLLAADTIRFPREGFQTEITVANLRDGEVDETRLYRVLSRGNDNTIVLTLEPASERGQALLMRGRDLWIYMPAVSQPIRLSLSQRLTGEVANGDLARANFAGDYDARFLRQDTFEGTPVTVLQLNARGRGITYDSVHYWVDPATQRPLFAEFFARSGRKLKTMRYEAFRDLAGRQRPTRLVIDDALKEGRRSVLTYDTMILRDLPDHLFTRDYLKRLQ